jgi:hypothetical protein
MKLFFSSRSRLLFSIFSLTLGLLCWQKFANNTSLPTQVRAGSQAVSYRFLNDKKQAGLLPQPAIMIGVNLDKQPYLVGNTLYGEVTSLSKASVMLQNVTDKPIQQIFLKLTLYGFEGKPLSIIPSLPIWKGLDAGQTQEVPLGLASQYLQSKAAQLTNTLVNVDIKVDYVSYSNGNLWRYGLEHHPFNGFSRSAWVVTGREAAAEQLVREYQKQTGKKTVKAMELQQHFRNQRQKTLGKPVLMSGPFGYDCQNYLGGAVIDCGINSYSGCETVIDYGNYIPPLLDKFDAWDDVYCFPWGPTFVDCWTLPLIIGTYYGGPCPN